jgi:hypothetical protein
LAVSEQLGQDSLKFFGFSPTRICPGRLRGAASAGAHAAAPLLLFLELADFVIVFVAHAPSSSFDSCEYAICR